MQNLRPCRFIRKELGVDSLRDNARLRHEGLTMRYNISVLRSTFRVVLFAAETTAALAGFLFSAAQTGDRRDCNSTTIQYGILNYRTLELDEGTDPYGWYD